MKLPIYLFVFFFLIACAGCSVQPILFPNETGAYEILSLENISEEQQTHLITFEELENSKVYLVSISDSSKKANFDLAMQHYKSATKNCPDNDLDLIEKSFLSLSSKMGKFQRQLKVKLQKNKVIITESPGVAAYSITMCMVHNAGCEDVGGSLNASPFITSVIGKVTDNQTKQWYILPW